MSYVIVARHEYYGPSVEFRLVADECGIAKGFANRKEANAFLSHYDSGRYTLSHNESSRPTYDIRKVDRLPPYLAAQCS